MHVDPSCDLWTGEDAADMSDARDVVARLTTLTPARVWKRFAGHLSHAYHRGRWHAARAAFQVYDALFRSSNLPPGSLDRDCLAGISEHDFYLKKHHRYGPIFKMFWGSKKLKICVVGFPVARRLFAQHRKSLQSVHMNIEAMVPKGFLRCMTGLDHAHYRRRLIDAVRADLISQWEPELRRIAQTELSALIGIKTNPTQSARDLGGVLGRIAMKSLLLLFFGDSPGARRSAELECAFNRLGPQDIAYPIGPEQEAAYVTIHALALQVMDSMKNTHALDRRETAMGRLIANDGGSAIDDTALGNAIYMIEIGRHDMRGLWKWILKYLSDHPALPEEIRTLANDSEARRKLAEACVMETLRMDQAEALHRRATEEFSFKGYRIPKDSGVCVLLRESHRDPQVFAAPDRFNPHRFLQRKYSADEYSPFGVGEHQCIAGPLALGLSTIFVEELVVGFDWSVVADGPRYFGRDHWEPSPRFAIQLTRRRDVPMISGSCSSGVAM